MMIEKANEILTVVRKIKPALTVYGYMTFLFEVKKLVDNEIMKTHLEFMNGIGEKLNEYGE